MDFDFDKWANLAQQDPAAFEALRKETLEKKLKEFPRRHQRALKGLQFCIDMERRKSKTPMGACIRLSNMLKDKFHTDFFPAVGAKGSCIHSIDTPARKRSTAEVIPFEKPAKG